jgi:hypothetical protein
MWLAKAVGLFIANAIWRITGWLPAGRVLVRALGSPNENLRTIAGILLEKAGKKSEPLLQEALKKRENLSMVLIILGDIGARKFEPDIRHLSQDPDPNVASAARAALRILKAHN